MKKILKKKNSKQENFQKQFAKKNLPGPEGHHLWDCRVPPLGPKGPSI